MSDDPALKWRHSVPCPYCGARSGSVIESRPQPDGTTLRRRRCVACFQTFITDEVAVLPEEGKHLVKKPRPDESPDQ